MRPLEVAAGAEVVAGGLRGGQIGEGALGEDIGGNGAVAACDLALRLGMADPAMPDVDAQAQQPRLQQREAAPAGAGPRRPVVGGNCSDQGEECAKIAASWGQ